MERPFGTPVGRVQCRRQSFSSSPVETHRRPRVANHVVVGRSRVVAGVVQVQPGAIRVLIANEPIDTGLGRASKVSGAD